MRIPPVVRGLCLVLALGVPGSSAFAQRTSDLRTEAFRLYDAGFYREALPYLDGVLSRKHRDIEAHIKRGTIYLRLNQPEPALADFDSVIRFAPYFPGTFTDRGIANIMLGRLDAAKGDFGRAIALYQRPIGPIDLLGSSDPNSSWNLGGYAPPVSLDPKGVRRGLAHCGLGQVYHRLHQDEQAINEYNQAIALNPGDPNNYAGRGDAYAALDQLDAALADYNEAIRLNPNLMHAYANRGAALFWKGDPEHALADLDRALQLDPTDGFARRYRGSVLARLGQNEKALLDFDAALRVNPKDAGALKDRGGVLVQMGQYERALKDLDESLRLDPRRPSGYVNRGAAYNSLGRYEPALADLDEAIKLAPRNAAAHTNRGRTHFALGQYDKAIADLSEAVQLDPKSPIVHYNRAEIYARIGLLDRAIEDYDATTRLAPRFAPAYVGLGNVLDTLGKGDRAIEEYSMALRLTPTDSGVYCNRGNARRLRGDWDGAIADFSRVIEIDPRHADAFVSRGWSRLIAGREGANDDARVYLDLKRGDDKYAAYMAILGTLGARRVGRESEADGFLAEAIANTPPRTWPAPVLRHLRGTTTVEALLDAAIDDSQKTEAHAFVGVDRLFAGDQAAALEHLRWVLQHGVKSTLAIELAQETLRRIEGRNTLPEPIP
jgi:tetratricopeptide (TPR) repeat protein